MSAHSLLFERPVPGAQRIKEGYRLQWAGTAVMGILNLTPDSFSDGGKLATLEAARQAALAQLSAGAFILDIGGESTRPGAHPVDAAEEAERVLPLIRLLAAETQAVISVDTSKPEVAHEALRAGAHLVNDVTGLRPAMRSVCAEAGCPAVIMHMQGEPRTMQRRPSYADVTAQVADFLRQRADQALAAGVPSVVLDPGFGFGKTTEHNLTLVRNLRTFAELGHPVLLGASRKKTIGKLTATTAADSRDPGSVALHLYAALRGAALVRVHNVYAHVQALAVWQALRAPEAA